MPSPHARRIAAARLRRRVSARELGFRSTAEVEPLAEPLGQPRAVDAIQLGMEVQASGYNLFVTGAPGSGRETMVHDRLQQVAPGRPPASDWVYVENFTDRDRPIAIQLPAGRGSELAAAVDDFLISARRQVRQALESDEYARRRRDMTGQLSARRDAVLEGLREQARQRGFALEPTLTGIASVPLMEGHPITPEQFGGLSAADRDRLERAGEEIQEMVSDAMGELRTLEKEANERVRLLDREVAAFAIDPLLRGLGDQFADQPRVSTHLRALREDLLSRLQEFGGDTPEQPPAPLAELGLAPGTPLDRYRVNVFVTNDPNDGAPVVLEREPTYYNLMGRLDYRSAFGTMITNFHEIKPGALHRANGGFLVLHASDVLRSPFSWDALKMALRGREARIENLAAHLTMLPTATLRPEPIPLDVKVILIGSPFVYQLLCQVDDDFRELFKVRVDFSPDVDWTRESAQGYAKLVSRIVREGGLRHFSAGAVARVVEHGGRLREHQGKLTTRMADIADLVTEASHWAAKRQARLVAAADVQRAIEHREFRSNLIEERVREVIGEGTLRIETDGSRSGQVNGVAVLDTGDHSFGRPSRITCRTSVGPGSVVSIEREIELSGPVHSKGVLTLAGYLRATYAQNRPLAVTATISFEQSYNEVDGDSASSTELYALLSSLADVPVAQGIGVTGSVDQYGNVQAVGGVSTKIEGFFRVCADAGLTGHQGMLIPAANTSSLMLADDVVAAVRARRFHVWAVTTVDEGIEILTGIPAGRRRDGRPYPPGTIHRMVDDRLAAFADTARAFGEARPDGGRPASGRR